MASVAHEEYLWFYRETKEDLTFFRSLGVLENAEIDPDPEDCYYESGLT